MNKYTILIPCYNDWECLNLLIPNINEISKNIDEEVSILIINDASTIANNLSFNHMTYLKKIEVINLKKNVKAQKATAAGLSYLKKTKFQGSVILMDADGQDDPKNLLDIIKKSKKDPKKTISIHRTKREDTLVFKTFYYLYLLLTFLFTFKYMNFGAFSYLHYTSFDKILSTNDINLAYAAAVAKHFKQRNTISVGRKKRLLGTSKNNYLSLIHYAIKIISVFRYQVLINSIIIFSICFLFYKLFISLEFLLFISISIILFNIIVFFIYYKTDKQFEVDIKDNIKNLDNLKI